MQFSKIVATLAIAATASAVAVERRNGGGGSGGNCNNIAVCKSGDKAECSDGDFPTNCVQKGGDPYCCETAGLVNLLNCVSLLNGNDISIPISLLNGGLL